MLMHAAKSRARIAQEVVTLCFTILLLTIFLFGFGSEGYSQIMQAKFSIYLWLCVIYILTMFGIAVYRLVCKDILWPEPGGILSLCRSVGYIEKFSVLYLLLTWISAIFSPYWPRTVVGVSRYEGALTISLYVISFLLIASFGKPMKIQLWVMGTMLIFFCAICFVQISGGNPLGLYPKGLSYFDAGIKYSGAYLGTIGNVDLVAAFLSLCVPVLLIALFEFPGHYRLL